MTVFFRHSKHLLASLALFSVLGLMLAMRPTPSAMERVIARGELVVLTRPSNTTYYEDQHGFTGMEYELAKVFADSLGVERPMVSLQSGMSSRRKSVRITGVTASEARASLGV